MGGVPGTHGVKHGGKVQGGEGEAGDDYDVPERLGHQQHPGHQHRVDDEVGEVVYPRHQGGGQKALAGAGQQAAALLVPPNLGAHPLEKVVADALHHGGHHHSGQEGQDRAPRQGGQKQEEQHKGEAVGQHQRQGHHAPVAEFTPGDGVVPRLRRPAQEGVEQQVQRQIVEIVQ